MSVCTACMCAGSDSWHIVSRSPPLDNCLQHHHLHYADHDCVVVTHMKSYQYSLSTNGSNISWALQQQTNICQYLQPEQPHSGILWVIMSPVVCLLSSLCHSRLDNIMCLLNRSGLYAPAGCSARCKEPSLGGAQAVPSSTGKE